MGFLARRGTSGQLYTAKIAGRVPTAAELETFKNLIEERGDTLALESVAAPEKMANPPGTAFGRGFGAGLAGIGQMAGRTIQQIGEETGLADMEDYGRGIVERKERGISEKAGYMTRLGDIEGLGDALRYGGETLGQGVATLLPTAAAVLATRGAVARTGLAPLAKDVVATSAGVATNYPILFGENLLEQDASVEEGIIPHVDPGAAALFALPAAFLDTLGDQIVLGMGGKFVRPLLTKKFYQSVPKSLAKRAGAGAVRGVVAEVPTEIGQQILTRIQAGKPIDSPEAYREYLEVGVAAGIVGGTVRGSIEAAKGDEARRVAKAQLNQDRAESAERVAEQLGNVKEHDEVVGRVKTLTELEDEQLGIVGQDPVELVDEAVTPDIMSGTLARVQKEVASNFVPIPIKKLPVQERDKVREGRRAAGIKKAEDVNSDVSVDEIEAFVGRRAANREARLQKPHTSSLRAVFARPDGFRWSDYERAVRLAISQTLGNDNKPLENANISIADIMRAANVTRGAAARIRKRMVLEGVVEEYARNRYRASPDAESKARPLREAEEELAKGQALVEAAEKVVRKEERAVAKGGNPEAALETIEKEKLRIKELRDGLDALAAYIKKQRRARKANFTKAGPQTNTLAQNEHRNRRGEAVRMTLQFRNAIDEIQNAVEKRLEKLGIRKDLADVVVLDQLARGQDAGVVGGEFDASDPKALVMRLSTAMYGIDTDIDELTTQVMGVANHETIHALREIGLFSETEWNTLAKAAAKRKYVKVNSDGTTERREYTFLERAKADYEPLGYSPDSIQEEAVAEMFRLWAGGDIKAVGAPKTLFQRILDFFRGLVGGLNDAGVASPDQLFESIESGEAASVENRARVGREGASRPDAGQSVRESRAENLIKSLENLNTPGQAEVVDDSFWYGRSAGRMTDLTEGDLEEARKLAAMTAVAMASPDGPSPEMAVRGWEQLRAGEPLRDRSLSPEESKAIEDAYGGKAPDGAAGAVYKKLVKHMDGVRRNPGQISTETIPSRESGHLPEAFDAPEEVLAEFHEAMSEIIFDGNGRDVIAKAVGLTSPGRFDAPGYFEGKTSPGTQTLVYLPPGATGLALNRENTNRLNEYAAIYGIVFKQDGVGWHRPFYDAGTDRDNGVEIRLGRPLTADEQKVFAEEMRNEFGHDEFGGVASPTGLRVIHWDYMYPEGAASKEKAELNRRFHNQVRDAMVRAGERLEISDDSTADIITFYAEHGYVGNDWKESLNGEDYIEKGRAGRPDFYRRSSVLITQLQNRAREVEQDFAERYGWTINEDLNREHTRKATDIEPVGPDSAEGLGLDPGDAAKLGQLPVLPTDADGKKLSYLPADGTPEYTLVPHRREGFPPSIHGMFQDFDMQRKPIILTAGRHASPGDRSGMPQHGIVHMASHDNEFKRHTKFDNSQEAFDAFMLKLTDEGYTPRILETEGRSDDEIRNELMNADGIYMYQDREFAYSKKYPGESWQLNLVWTGPGNGMKRGEVINLSLHRLSGAQIDAIVSSGGDLPADFLFGGDRMGRVYYPKTIFPKAFDAAKGKGRPRPPILQFKTKLEGAGRLLSSIADDGTEDRSRGGGRKLSVALAADTQPVAQVGNSRGVYLYGKSADVLAKALKAPLSAVQTMGILSDTDSKKLADGLLDRFQDAFLPVGQFIDGLRKAGFNISDAFDTYLMEEQYHNKTGNKLRIAREELFEPFANSVKDLGVPTALRAKLMKIRGDDEFGLFETMVKGGADERMALAETWLYARHAKERNAHINKMDAANTKGSGMSDAQADGIMEAIAAMPHIQSKLEDISTQAAAIVEATRRNDIETGLEPDRRAELTYEGSQTVVPYPEYRFYVPLKGFLETDPDIDPADPAYRNSKNKYGAKGKEYMTAMGRASYAGDIIASLFAQHQRSIDRGERNLVGRSFLDLVTGSEEVAGDRAEEFAALTEDVAEVVERLPTKKVLTKDGVIRNMADRSAVQNDPNMFTVKVNGGEVRLNVKDARLAKALKGATGLGPDNSNQLVSALGKVNRYFASINTSFNPEFFVTNFVRDISTGLTNVNATELESISSEVLKGIRPALSGLYNVIVKDNKSHEYYDIYQRFLANGGQSALNMVDGLNQQITKINDTLDFEPPTKSAAALRAIRKLPETKPAKFIYDINTVIENGIRVATFKTLLDRGFTEERAAQAARNVTVNFSKGGEYKSFVNSLYLFYNASIQGSFALLNAAARSKKVRRIWAGAVALGVLQDQLAAMISEEDEDGLLQYDKVDDHILEHNLVFPNFMSDNRDYIKIPMPYGLNMAVNFGRALSRTGRGQYTPGQFVNTAFGTAVDALNPMGGTESFANFALPTVLDPVADIMENENYANRPVYREGSRYGLQKPDSQLYWSTTSPVFVKMAQFMNAATGGNEVRKGLIDFSPDVAEFWFGYLTGGVGRFVERSGRAAYNLVDDPAALFSEEGVRSIPFANRVYGSVSDREDLERFIAARDRVLTVDKEIELAAKSRDFRKVRRLKEKHPEEVKLVGRMKAANNARNRIIRKMTEVKNNPMLSESAKRKMLDRLDEQLQRATQRGNAAANELT